MSATFDDLYQLFYVAAYGCNRQCEREIKSVFSIHGQDTPFLFFEFFLTQPLPKQTDRWTAGWEQSVHVLAPFAPRLVEHSVAISDHRSTDAVRLTIRRIRESQKLRLSFRWDHSAFTRAGWNHWRGQVPPVPAGRVRLRLNNIVDAASGASHPIMMINNWSLRWQIDRYTESLDPFSSTSGYYLAGLFSTMLPGRDLGSKPIPSIFVPIASTRLFYGGVWVMLPGLGDTILDGRERTLAIDNFRKALGLRIAQTVDKTYLPVLALLNEYWLEHLHDDSMTKKTHKEVSCEFQTIIPSGSRTTPAGPPLVTGTFPAAVPTVGGATPAAVRFRNTFAELEPIPSPRADSAKQRTFVADDLEDLFRKLWARRSPGGCWDEQPAFGKSLAFKNYLVCSESMIRLLHKVVQQASSLRKSNDTLPGCLVVGGAGSGKEKLAKMLRLFSNTSDEGGYCNGKEHVVNLAAIRPAPVTAAIMTGLEVNGTTEFHVKGILAKVRETAGVTHPTLRLDEFNSMDPDSQGVLLRFLDNSEIVPVGALEDPVGNTDCLVVGIMNEDPEDISRERAMEFFRNGEYLGSFLGDLLYEHFLKIRRLRPDVMYRMIRNGKFVIPPLRQRNEDVPLLLQVFIRDELRAGAVPPPETKLHITLDCLDCLMSPALLWPGNVRQLQAVAKLIAEGLRLTPQIDEWHILTLPILEKALLEVRLLQSQR